MSAYKPNNVASLAAQMRAIFSAAVLQVGLRGATRMWNNVIRAQNPRRGRPRKSVLSSSDAFILEIYDALLSDPNPKALPRHLSILLKANDRTRYQSVQAEAVEKRIRRLVADRDAGTLQREDRGDQLARYKLIPRSRGQ